jgi:hypothetical protein
MKGYDVKWIWRAKEKEFEIWGINIKHFMSKSSGRMRQNLILSLKNGASVVES